MDRFTDLNRRQIRRAWIARFDRACEAVGKAAVIGAPLWILWKMIEWRLL